MPSKDRKFRPVDGPSGRKVLSRRKSAGAFGTVSSPDPVAGALRAIIKLASEADAQHRSATPGAGRPIDREQLLAVLVTVERRRHRVVRLDRDGVVVPGQDGYISRVGFEPRQLGVVPDQSDLGWQRVGTAEKGEIVQTAAEILNLSPQRVRDLARQLADLAATIPEKMINRE